MAVVSLLVHTILHQPLYLFFAALIGSVLYHLGAYLRDPYGYNSNQGSGPIPGPFIAKFSDVWLARRAALGDRSGDVHEAHKKYGKVVRIAPNHISIADPAALQIVYAHGNGSLKSDFYDAFVSIHRGLFNTRDRAEHTRKRKIVSNIFSQQSVLQFEPYIRSAIALLIKRWDDMYTSAVVRREQQDDDKDVFGRDGRVWFDCLNWYNYLAFDIIGDLAFGSPFDMLRAGRDSAPVAKPDGPTLHLPAVEILNYRGTYSASLGVVPAWARPYIRKYVPWYSKGSEAVKNLAGIAIAAVEKRLAQPSDRNDLLSKLQRGKDAEGKPMGRAELTAEALTQLIAGSDTTSNSSCAISYYLAINQHAQQKLQAELDEVLGPILIGEPSLKSSDPFDATHYESAVAPSDVVKNLPYLAACINEGLRLHSTSGIGLPRIVPPGGLLVDGRMYPEGCILSVPTFTIHRDPEVWGPDVDVYRPERWFEEDKKEKMWQAFNAFSYGPRACVGKNLANMELQVIIGSIFRRFDFVMMNPDIPMETCEGFLRKPLGCFVGIKLRNT